MSSPTPVPSVRAWRAGLLCGLLAAAVLSACGGASSDPSSASASGPSEQASSSTASTFLPSSNEPPSARTIALQEEGARLNQQELQAIAKTATLPVSTGGPSLSGTPQQKERKAGAAPVTKTAAYRFFNTRTGAHFYTTSTAERDAVLARYPFMHLDGPAFDVSPSPLTVLSPVYRFYNTLTGVHFYTISEAEKQHIIANLKSFNFEGVAYHAAVLPGSGYTPLFRFFLPSRGYHFYTASEQERDHIIANLKQYTYEGIAYYVLGQEWQAPVPVPHTGVLPVHCYGDNTGDNLIDCASDAATRLNRHQDGQRADIRPMNYEPVGTYPLSDCVKDNATGLVWEGKPMQGPRAVSKTFTNLANEAPDDASTYVKEVNASRLCGFDDWRLPTLQELYGIVHLGKQLAPFIDQAWFENSAPGEHWTSNRSAIRAFGVDLSSKRVRVWNTSSTLAARLVRGAPAWEGTRYLVTTREFGTDAAKNAVVDRRTGMVWRRCLNGTRWNGSQCDGVPALTSQADALKTPVLPFWRIPSIKELQGLLDIGVSGNVPSGDFFPQIQPGLDSVWSTTPDVATPGQAMRVQFVFGIESIAPAGRNAPSGTLFVFADE